MLDKMYPIEYFLGGRYKITMNSENQITSMKPVKDLLKDFESEDIFLLVRNDCSTQAFGTGDTSVFYLYYWEFESLIPLELFQTHVVKPVPFRELLDMIRIENQTKSDNKKRIISGLINYVTGGVTEL